MKQIVIMPGGFHPFHAGHRALYDAAVGAFPRADVFVAATRDTSSRPFPFELKKKLAQAAGVPEHRFIEVKSPFQAREITQMYDPDTTELIFVRSEKDRDEAPRPGGVKRDGSASYLQPWRRGAREPMSQHGYMHYLPVAQFGPGMTSATEIRAKWPSMTDGQKNTLVSQLYPDAVRRDLRLVEVIRNMIDEVLVPEQRADETMMGAPVGSGAMRQPRVPAANAQRAMETRLSRDPQGDIQIEPRDTQQQLGEIELRQDVARQLGEIVSSLKSGQYRNVEHLIYGAGGLENRIRALARFQDWQEQGDPSDISDVGIGIGDEDYALEKY